jgi:DNA-binding PadR family transcriptional regulator
VLNRKRKSHEMPAEHALLGLLAMSDGSRHGYDLARAFQPDSELGEIIKLEPGMLYHHLKKLERLGWVTSHQEQVDRRPARSVYTLTDSGRDELANWMTEPVEHTREIRLAFLVKLYLARQSDPDRAAALVDEQIATLERVEMGQREMPETGSFSEHVRDLRQAQTRTAITWLKSLRSAN